MSAIVTWMFSVRQEKCYEIIKSWIQSEYLENDTYAHANHQLEFLQLYHSHGT